MDESELAGLRTTTSVGDDEVVNLIAPPANGPLARDIQVKVGDHLLPAPYVACCPDVMLLGRSCTPIDATGRIIAPAIISSNYEGLLVHVDSRALARILFGRWRYAPGDAREFPRAVLLVNGWSRSYFHWLVELLPRLTLSGDTDGWGREKQVLIEESPPAWQVDSLVAMGVGRDAIASVRGPVHVRELVVPAFPRRLAHGQRFSLISPRMIRETRSRLLASLGDRSGPARGRRVFVSRADAVGRRIVNEDELIAALERLGFERVCLSGMTLRDQARIFSDAEVVIGPHGAGLTNILFARNALVVELFGDYVNASYYTLAAALGHRYLQFFGTSAQPLLGSRADIHIDVAALRAFLVENGLEERSS